MCVHVYVFGIWLGWVTLCFGMVLVFDFLKVACASSCRVTWKTFGEPVFFICLRFMEFEVISCFSFVSVNKHCREWPIDDRVTDKNTLFLDLCEWHTQSCHLPCLTES